MIMKFCQIIQDISFFSVGINRFFKEKLTSRPEYGIPKIIPRILYNGPRDFLNTKFFPLRLQSLLKEHLIFYPTPVNFNYMWSFGSLSGIFFLIQVITGVFLAMHYTPHIEFAFSSLENIMRDLNYGWFFRYLHANGASFFFIMVYFHIIKALYYGSFLFPYIHLWRLGVLIFFLMMAIAFMGYVLPWGQMSFRGATVITNLFTAIPLIGHNIVFWLWGGFSVDNATLNRFFSFHYVLPFILAAIIFLHLILLHLPGSSNPIKLAEMPDKLSFFPYFYFKDLFSVFFIFLVFSIFVFFFPNYLGHFDNYIPANPLVTPTHIVPEWYFLAFYAILRSIPNKVYGVFFMLFALVILLFLPTIYFLVYKRKFFQGHPLVFRNPKYRPVFRGLFWCFVCNFILLGIIGGKPVEQPFACVGLYCTLFYFLFFLLLFLNLFFFEKYFLLIFCCRKKGV